MKQHMSNFFGVYLFQIISIPQSLFTPVHVSVLLCENESVVCLQNSLTSDFSEREWHTLEVFFTSISV